jgi:hypothetical protein
MLSGGCDNMVDLDLPEFLALWMIILLGAGSTLYVLNPGSVPDRKGSWGTVTCTVLSDQGILTSSHHNINSFYGEQYVRNFIGFGNLSTTDNKTIYIACGNGTPSTTLSILNPEITTLGFSRVAGNVTTWYNTTTNHYAYNVTAMFHATGHIRFSTVSLNFFSRPNSNYNLFASGYIVADGSMQVFETSWTLIAKWVITIQAY